MDSIFICGSGIAVKSRSRGGGILFSDNEFGVGICCIGVGIGLNGIGLAPNGVENALILSNNETGGGGGGGGTASKYLWIVVDLASVKFVSTYLLIDFGIDFAVPSLGYS